MGGDRCTQDISLLVDYARQLDDFRYLFIPSEWPSYINLNQAP